VEEKQARCTSMFCKVILAITEAGFVVLVILLVVVVLVIVVVLVVIVVVVVVVVVVAVVVTVQEQVSSGRPLHNLYNLGG
jgi:hypothetical protein